MSEQAEMAEVPMFERMGLWLSQNPHDVLAAVRCQKGDGRILAKVCEVEGMRWVWFAASRPTAEALISDEIEELRDLPTADGSTHPEEIDAIISELRAGPSRLPMSPRAYPETDPKSGRYEGWAEIVNCAGCRTRYEARYLGSHTFSVLEAPYICRRR
ncbi:hypothetical protein [Nocardioides sp. Kera G14]|uniref:hypothetical protein n=1 Tax=Nocardioides sp. Kera G14 TaxID=2884264 RepID=UPI001D11E2FC|nr:hypothetical protein [Nocardioides sp. Kera G14]UDY22402.1 hypothetical protein LH076_09950 [Nocardioides sp. Kera G14]